jgi:hypothetical protein
VIGKRNRRDFGPKLDGNFGKSHELQQNRGIFWQDARSLMAYIILKSLYSGWRLP